ncbi:EAL domain-containing protein [Psychrosphaera sp. 1_MG-2023]|uniref:EAL domain-containing protein n=1 Tax=Psychrosphaera sp. 1_MG-2023 TaxID=3062643 RepID=UPI0026E2F076|nr:EAL domain-containing protein [Psychrosphaera sp. 1_MG-2023]MDO6719522.1 EAL domain-containing protein [Psychrosphaera sp. 1_MG-2023]
MHNGRGRILSLKYFRLFTLSISLLLFAISSSANPLFDPIRNTIHFQHLDIESSLPHPTVFDVVQDKEGFIWFATQGGIAKFNGTNSTLYSAVSANENGLNSNWIWQLLVDSEGRVWATSNSGIHLYIPEKDKFINFNSESIPQIKSRNFYSLVEIGNGDLWFAGETDIVVFNSKTSKFGSISGSPEILSLLQHSKVRAIAQSNKNIIWLATVNNGLYRSEDYGQSFSILNSKANTLPTNKLISLDIDSEQRVWAGTEGDGLLLISESGEFIQQYTSPSCSRVINDVLVDHSDTVWLATPDGICEFNPTTERFIAHKKESGRISSLINDDVRVLMQDEGGVIWAGTVSGVSKWNAKLADFTHIAQFSPFGTMTSASVTSFAMNNNNLFVGTVDGGVNILNFDTKTMSPFNSSFSDKLKNLDSSLITSLLVDGDTGLWVGTYDKGLFHIDLTNYEQDLFSADSEFSHRLSHNAISKIIQLSNGNIAVSTYGGGVNIIDSVSKSIIHNKSQIGSSMTEAVDLILDIFEDNNKDLWLATHGGGLVHYDTRNNKSSTYSTKQKGKYFIGSDEIFSVIKTAKGVWLATSDAGLLLIEDNDNKTQHIINQSRGLASNFTYSLLEDDLGYIWISHAKGLSRLNPNNFEINNFNTTHGLQSSDFNNSAYYKAKDGRLFFGGTNGFNTFQANKVPLNSYKPKLKLTKFVHANEEKPIQTMLRADGVLELNYEDTIIDFEFAALDYTKPSNNRYQYMMEGLSSSWSNIGTSNHISFSYLADGSYTLKVRGSNNEEVWSEILQIPIEVMPPIWKTTHAKLFYIFGPILIFLQLLRNQRIRHQRQLSHERRLHQLAYFDGLTGLPNRQSFYESLDKFISLARRGNYKAGVMFIDLDRFKRINDTLGHDYGDLVLQEIAQRLKECVRDSDFVARNYEVNSVNNEIARLGGDEFTLFLSHVESAAETTLITQRIIESLSRPIKIDSYELTVTPSVGIALYPEHGTTVHELMKHADIAMYQAKEDGRRTFKFYSNELNDRALERLQLEEKMRNAVKNNEFVLHYQPQVDIVSNEITKAEALIRWNSPELGFISPAEFIPIAEESGLIIELGNWILDTACKQAKQWLDEGLENCKVSVNVSSVQFKQTALIDNVRNALTRSGLPPELLELELTESAVMSDVDDNIDRLQQFKDMGITIAIDDFGTGYSSLSYLKKFPIDTLKIDRSFIIEIANSDNDAAIVKAIMLLAETMELKVVAEGIENVEQLQILHNYRCQFIQGYFFSRPLVYEEFFEFASKTYYEEKRSWQLASE